jgi:hypothetical protein
MALDTRFPAGMTRFLVLLKHLAIQEESLGAIQYYCQIIGIILILFVFHVVDVRTL